MLQEVVAGLTQEATASLETKEKKVPQFPADAPVKKTPKELAQGLKDLKK